jgi:hypothetical protein
MSRLLDVQQGEFAANVASKRVLLNDSQQLQLVPLHAVTLLMRQSTHCKATPTIATGTHA